VASVLLEWKDVCTNKKGVSKVWSGAELCGREERSVAGRGQLR
jgi:hypothetical protein